MKRLCIVLAAAAFGCAHGHIGDRSAGGLPDEERAVVAYFGEPFAGTYEVRRFESRGALDAFAAARWKMPPSQCWAVAMGSGSVLAYLDPTVWAVQACEHDGANAAHVRQVLTHELVHVYHGQRCPNPEFDGMDDMGWFVEGVAILAAGQLDAHRVEQARAAAARGEPRALRDAWSGSSRYAVAGSMAAYIEASRGRGMLKTLMAATTNEEALRLLGVTESELLSRWRAWVARGDAKPAAG